MSKSGPDSEDPADVVDGCSASREMLNIAVWTPAAIVAVLIAAVAAVESPLPSVAWMMVVVGGYIGRDVEALVRLRKQ